MHFRPALTVIISIYLAAVFHVEAAKVARAHSPPDPSFHQKVHVYPTQEVAVEKVDIFGPWHF